MKDTAEELSGETYALGAASQLTGLTPELLRAWEKRYGVVTPLRTPGGSRRYRVKDLERLRLVKATVDAGYRIGQVAKRGSEELERLAGPVEDEPRRAILEEALEAIASLDATECRRLLSMALMTLGPVRFAKDVAAPLAETVGERWAAGSLSIASEHMATALLGNLLVGALQPTLSSMRGPKLLLATPQGEPHELGLQLAALTALGAGADPLYLGAGLPPGEFIQAAYRSGASAVVLSVVTLPAATALEELATLREGLDPRVHIWVGGRGAKPLAKDLQPGIEYIDGLANLERRIARLRLEK
jgi:DNA-binding transcriptional MerR regulator/methylmalonyl-CoA mutase cobalamin-binding subunit